MHLQVTTTSSSALHSHRSFINSHSFSPQATHRYSNNNLAASMAKGFKAMCNIALVMSLILALMTSQTVNAVSCADGVQALFPCEQFLLGGGSNQPSSECCAGVQNLNNMASTVEDRRTLCECFKNAAGSYGINSQRAEELPGMCHIGIRLNISPGIDCST